MDGERHRPENEENYDIFRPYQWTIPPLHGGLDPIGNNAEQDTAVVGGRQFTFRREVIRGTSDSTPVEMAACRCLAAVWTRGPERLVNRATGEVICQVEVELDTPPCELSLRGSDTFSEAPSRF